MGRYCDDKPEYKTRGFYLEVVMDHTRIPSYWSLWRMRLAINVSPNSGVDLKDEDLADAAEGRLGRYGRPGAGGMLVHGGPRPGARAQPPGRDENGPVNNRSPLDDPKLANVAIVGVIYIFKKSEEKPGATSRHHLRPARAGSGESPLRRPGGRRPGQAPTGQALTGKTPAAAAETESETASADDTTAEPADPKNDTKTT